MNEAVWRIRRGRENGDGERPILGEDRVDGVRVWPRTSSENAERGEVIIEGLGLALPRDTPADATDQWRARGEVWDVEGAPGDFGKRVLVYLKKVGARGA